MLHVYIKKEFHGNIQELREEGKLGGLRPRCIHDNNDKTAPVREMYLEQEMRVGENIPDNQEFTPFIDYVTIKEHHPAFVNALNLGVYAVDNATINYGFEKGKFCVFVKGATIAETVAGYQKFLNGEAKLVAALGAKKGFRERHRSLIIALHAASVVIGIATMIFVLWQFSAPATADPDEMLSDAKTDGTKDLYWKVYSIYWDLPALVQEHAPDAMIQRTYKDLEKNIQSLNYYAALDVAKYVNKNTSRWLRSDSQTMNGKESWVVFGSILQDYLWDKQLEKQPPVNTFKQYSANHSLGLLPYLESRWLPIPNPWRDMLYEKATTIPQNYMSIGYEERALELAVINLAKLHGRAIAIEAERAQKLLR